MPELVADLLAGTVRPVYRAPQFPRLDQTPIPRYDLVKLRHYVTMAAQFSRGCPFDCEFCDIIVMNGRVPRTKSPGQFLAELEALRRLGWKDMVFVVDDNFIGNKPRTKALLHAIIEWRKRTRPEMGFLTEASINLADDAELIRLMTDAGFDAVFVGIETPDGAALAECNKRQNQSRNLVEDVKRIQRAGLQVQGGFIVGFDSDLPGIFQRQVDFIQQSGIVTAMVGLLNALPDTKLHARLKREGRLVGRTSGDNVDGTMNFTPRMPAAQLLAGYKTILRRIYAPRPYYQRIRTLLREYRRPRITEKFNWRHGFALAWSSVRLGVVGRERFQYWRLIVWTLFHRPALLQLAVTLAIYVHHFRKCCNAVGV